MRIKMKEKTIYQSYSNFLKKKYGEKVYKLPINLPLTCPNRINSSGCSFCAEAGTGFEAQASTASVTEQLLLNKENISKKYNAAKFIAYFQNYTNTFLLPTDFEAYLREAAGHENIVEIAVSTRPDCIRKDYLDIMQQVSRQYNKNITVELGLQTINYHTLAKINRGHGLAEFLDAVNQTASYEFEICVHVILNLPYDNNDDAVETAKVLSVLPVTSVKIHSLYIPKNTLLCKQYENGTITICEKKEYLERLALFIEYLRPDMVVERLFGRVPEEDAVFCNWGTSWWKLKDEFIELMESEERYQGKNYHYRDGAALSKLPKN